MRTVCLASIALLLAFAAAPVFASIQSADAVAREEALLQSAAAAMRSPEALRDRLRDGMGGEAWRDFERSVTPQSLVGAILKHAAGDELVQLRGRRMGNARATDEDAPLPYWRFVPKYEGSAMLGGTMSWATPCFGNVTAVVDAAVTTSADNATTLGITVHTKQPTSAAPCESQFMFTTAYEHAKLLSKSGGATQTRVTLDVSGFGPAQKWLLDTYGVRMHTQNVTGLGITASLIDTFMLFLPRIDGHYSATIEAENMRYFNGFTKLQPPVAYRSRPGLLGLNESDIMDGDVIFCSDMDGLGPTESLGEGATPDHVAVLIRDDDEVLNVCESTTPEVVCTPYQQWITHAALAPRTIILAPLRPDLRANFNRSAAWAFINSTVGYSYGYYNFLFGWIDTPNDNYPCLPGGFTRCIVWEHAEYLLQFLERLSPAITTKFVGQALNHRVNATGLPIADVLMRGAQVFGYRGGDITAVPEDDDWTYRTTRYGKPAIGLSNVCSTYVCNVLRHGGAFAGTALAEGIQCTEQTPWNMQALQLWDAARMGANRPEVCKQAEPDNQNCVLCGHTTFHLGPNSNSKPLAAWTGERCGGRAPWYVRNVSSC